MGELVYKRRPAPIWMLLGALGFVAAGVWIMTSNAPYFNRYPMLYRSAVGVASIAFFGLCFVVGVTRRLGESLRISASEAMFHESCSIDLGDIDHIVVMKFKGNPFFAVVVKEGAVLRGSISRRQQWGLKANRAMFGVPGIAWYGHLDVDAPLVEVARTLASRANCRLIDLTKSAG